MRIAPMAPILALAMISSRVIAQDPLGSGAEILEKENVLESAKLHAPWGEAYPIQPLDLYEQVRTGALSRGLVQLLDRTTARLDQNSQVAILSTETTHRKAALNLRKGQIYVRDREQTGDLEIVTPGGVVLPHGTEFQVAVDEAGKAEVSAFEGTVEMQNAAGTETVAPGEQGYLQAGRKPYKTAAIYARNDIIQWALYYPAVLDPREMGLRPAATGELAGSLAAYEAGDLLGALRLLPANFRPRGAAEQLYRAAVLLAVGRLDQAAPALRSVPKGTPNRNALEEMIAAVKFENYEPPSAPASAGEWMAVSYLRQSTGELDAALAAARAAARLAPSFGYAWERVAELEFSFGRTGSALEALGRGLAASPRHAQGHALRGFLLSARNEIGQARASFETALSLDGALGNAWLGRGLTYIRQGNPALGNRDLQAAAGLEPSRALLHSYLGKAFSQTGETAHAQAELARAKVIDPKDPTPYLYAALEDKQENRYNAAVRELETSVLLNDNRRVFRSQFLLDQDRSVRGANLAAIYLNDGLVEQSVREAVQAVNDDYASAPAHLFLAESYDALRDPRRLQLRYEAPWFAEVLISNLLSPVGGGSLSQFVSQQEYTKLFESDGVGISSSFDYLSRGAVHETASQFGTFGNFEYALDAEYFYDRGFRANSAISNLEGYFTMKLQLDPADTVFFKTSYEDTRNGSDANTYDPRNSALTTAGRTLAFHESEEPGLLLVGLHHEWAPGIHTLFLAGRLANDQSLFQRETGTADVQALAPPPLAGGAPDTNPPTQQQIAQFDAMRGSLDSNLFRAPDLAYGAQVETYTGELQQIFELGPMTLVAGGRYQKGRFHTDDLFTERTISYNSTVPFRDEQEFDFSSLRNFPNTRDSFTVPFERTQLYLYDTWQATRWLSFTGGFSWDRLRYPDDFRSAPVSGETARRAHLSPKAGFILRPTRSLTIRGAYAEAVSGASIDEDVRLEPVQVAGFNQSFRTLIPEDLMGEQAGSRFRLWGLSLEQKLLTGTYLGVEADLLEQRVSTGLGDLLVTRAYNDIEDVLDLQAQESLNYREQVITATINQLLGEEWSIGARFQYTASSLHTDVAYNPIRSTLVTLDRIPLAPTLQQRMQSDLGVLSLFVLYNHPTGLFARAEANWYTQTNAGYAVTPSENPQVGADFWQFNVLAGWRFYRNQCELSAGILNLAGRDYRLEPLNPYFEIPRERTFVVHCRLAF
jgi:Tfp pilus assembly protein PilF